MPMKKYVIILILGLLILSGAISCPIYNFVGVPCPACGITRAIKLFFTGHIRDAFLMHPLFWMPAIFLIKPFQKKWLIITALAVFIITYVIRLCVMFPTTPPLNYNYNSIIGEFLK